MVYTMNWGWMAITMMLDYQRAGMNKDACRYADFILGFLKDLEEVGQYD